jgi:hypothetical protein
MKIGRIFTFVCVLLLCSELEMKRPLLERVLTKIQKNKIITGKDLKKEINNVQLSKIISNMGKALLYY